LNLEGMNLLKAEAIRRPANSTAQSSLFIVAYRAAASFNPRALTSRPFLPK
jgi:hypothetical protein